MYEAKMSISWGGEEESWLLEGKENKHITNGLYISD